MLTSARFLGAFPGAGDVIPGSVLATVRDQLGLAASVTPDGYLESRSRIRHLALIRHRFGFTGFTDFGDNAGERFRLTRWLYVLCWSGDDHPGPLIERAASWLIANKILLPGITILERMVGRIRERARSKLWSHLVGSLSDVQRARIAQLFDKDDTAAFAALDSLRTVPTKRASTELFRHLDRLEAVRAFGLRPSPPSGVPAATIKRLARVARVGKPPAIAALQEPRRTATVAGCSSPSKPPPRTMRPNWPRRC
jgi:hypothetical protein